MIDNLETLNPEDFATICEATCESNKHMVRLLQSAEARVKQWLSEDGISDVNDLVSITAAYGESSVPCPDFESLEIAILKRA